jgi:hypothetical protein
MTAPSQVVNGAASQTDRSAQVVSGQLTNPAEQELRMLPKECGVALMGFGIIGVMLLDPFDVFFVLAGALVFTPQLFHRTELCIQARFPGLHREGRRYIDRFIDAFEKRYPPNLH